ncbi:methyltransferase domain-containing protein [Streptomyces spiramenti]|uniref:Trans-aconitate 2-methyltransferase n=1 Tax=Streptomyces spiramenti TaxID=2720606 RepID=A0ABX1ALY2_9ACTN|nr:methyltransferase domain-containing protein [Streptomyces spiramenti]NJP66403.1 methyltransferase domain-containing protein [Streptomyces spiramenti]
MTTTRWDPDQYNRYADHRTRPLRDLIARVPALAAEELRIADLGCGPGGPTAVLAERWGRARITGYDSSAEMLARASRLAGPTPGGGSLAFEQADIAAWRPDRDHDLIVSNAALQWVPDHVALFPRWIAALAPGGALAFQVPGNFGAPSHLLLRVQCLAPRWRDRLGGLLREVTPVHEPGGYLDALSVLGCEVDTWETVYHQLLPGPDPVLEWMRGTALLPVLDALADDPGATEAFLAEYRDRLRTAYPAGSFGTVLPFRRIFVVARRRAG